MLPLQMDDGGLNIRFSIVEFGGGMTVTELSSKPETPFGRVCKPDMPRLMCLLPWVCATASLASNLHMLRKLLQVPAQSGSHHKGDC